MFIRAYTQETWSIRYKGIFYYREQCRDGTECSLEHYVALFCVWELNWFQELEIHFTIARSFTLAELAACHTGNGLGYNKWLQIYLWAVFSVSRISFALTNDYSFRTTHIICSSTFAAHVTKVYSLGSLLFLFIRSLCGKDNWIMFLICGVFTFRNTTVNFTEMSSAGCEAT